ncbi:hypothetical protein [Salinicoccus albus]|uniref:hypothetical protein n=1 Tax=Salinicoccus albus TaxID=418756 RepID=UPI00037A0538|nr:hypothetical protein [Salinicoccus albus]
MNPGEYLTQKSFRVSSKWGEKQEHASLSYDTAWLWKGRFRVNTALRRRHFPSLKGAIDGTVEAGALYTFDKLYNNDGYWWLRILDNNALWFIAVGVTDTGTPFRQAGARRKLWGTVSALDTTGGREKKRTAL